MVIAGAALSLLAIVASFSFIVVIGIFSCRGTDTSEPPAPGTRAAALCGWPHVTAGAILMPLAIAAPLVGAGVAAVQGRTRPLLLGFAVAAGAMTLLSFVAELIEATGLFLVPSLVALVAAIALLTRVDR